MRVVGAPPLEAFYEAEPYHQGYLARHPNEPYIVIHDKPKLAALKRHGLEDNTLVIFTSDNGPWSNAADRLGPLHKGEIAWGSSGPLREAKGSSYEGGSRVPCLVRWPGRVPAGRVSDAIFSTCSLIVLRAASRSFAG